MADFDILIIGGGINGCGIARDAAGRGLRVCLAEADDLGGATSSASSKLIHGGVRYLEHYEFRLVREALKEREVLWQMAPHIIRPMRFVMPHHKAMRPAWLLRLGLFLYDHIGGRKLLPGTRSLDLRSDPVGHALKADFTKGFEYSDCWVEDSRLVILNARDAADRGAEIHVRCPVEAVEWQGDHWRVLMRDLATGSQIERRARVVINAAGPWVDEVLSGALGRNDSRNVRLVRGSHIVVPKLFDHDKAYIFQNPDQRIIFAIPYRDDFTLIGTTDAEHDRQVGTVTIAPEEVAYLAASANRYFITQIDAGDVVWSYSGVRPLYDDGASKAQEATRDYVIHTEAERPLINIFGGKITTFRKLSEAVMAEAAALLRIDDAPWTRGATLPGGDFPVTGFDDLVAAICRAYPFLDPDLARRYCRFYGTNVRDILGQATSNADLGQDFGHGIYAAELDHARGREWVREAEDFLFRRTRLGIDLPEEGRAAIAAYLQATPG